MGCRSTCDAFAGWGEYCCTGAHAMPSMCGLTRYSKMFKSACPMTHSYTYDDASSTCTAAPAHRRRLHHHLLLQLQLQLRLLTPPPPQAPAALSLSPPIGRVCSGSADRSVRPVRVLGSPAEKRTAQPMLAARRRGVAARQMLAEASPAPARESMREQGKSERELQWPSLVPVRE